MKVNWKSFLVVCVLLVAVVFTLNVIDAQNVDVSGEVATALKVTVLDMEGKGVHNAKVTVSGNSTSFFTDNKGISPTIELSNLSNYFDPSITQWFCVNVIIEKAGYVNTAVIGCVIYDSQTRHLTVKIYKNDSSELPFVCYVESPPSEYLESLFGK